MGYYLAIETHQWRHSLNRWESQKPEKSVNSLTWNPAFWIHHHFFDLMTGPPAMALTWTRLCLEDVVKTDLCSDLAWKERNLCLYFPLTIVSLEFCDLFICPWHAGLTRKCLQHHLPLFLKDSDTSKKSTAEGLPINMAYMFWGENRLPDPLGICVAMQMSFNQNGLLILGLGRSLTDLDLAQ